MFLRPTPKHRLRTYSFLCRLFSIASDNSDATILAKGPSAIVQGKIWKVNNLKENESSTEDHHLSEENWVSEENSKFIELHNDEQTNYGFVEYGVLMEDRSEDLKALVEGFTSPALAAALRDRESTLHTCAHLMDNGQIERLKKILKPFTSEQVYTNREATFKLHLSGSLEKDHINLLRKYLVRMPRFVTKYTEHRASVMVPLCNVDGVPSVLFTKRSNNLRKHKNEVCFPGGKVDTEIDKDIFNTAIREMIEEIGLDTPKLEVLGVLRCDWSEVASIVGVAVTPVVGFLGDLSKKQLRPNPAEVSHCFTVPIKQLLNKELWNNQKFRSPVFIGGPYLIWGLTGYILNRFVEDLLSKHLSV